MSTAGERPDPSAGVAGPGSPPDAAAGAAGGFEPPAAVAHPFADLLGLDVAVVAPGRARATLDVRPEHHNPNGVPHGAVLFALVDTSMGGATTSVLDAGRFCASIEVHLRFLAPAVGDRLVAESTVVRAGRRIVVLESRVTGQVAGGEPTLVATATGSFAVLGG